MLLGWCPANDWMFSQKSAETSKLLLARTRTTQRSHFETISNLTILVGRKQSSSLRRQGRSVMFPSQVRQVMVGRNKSGVAPKWANCSQLDDDVDYDDGLFDGGNVPRRGKEARNCFETYTTFNPQLKISLIHFSVRMVLGASLAIYKTAEDGEILIRSRSDVLSSAPTLVCKGDERIAVKVTLVGETSKYALVGLEPLSSQATCNPVNCETDDLYSVTTRAKTNRHRRPDKTRLMTLSVCSLVCAYLVAGTCAQESEDFTPTAGTSSSKDMQADTYIFDEDVEHPSLVSENTLSKY
uniref:Uncharacterized protein n=1 Tax=Timema poppense TaxID=170557 RepID=A0A7R9D847_TIMPO|nr:unnamed protein product [Timema poppensis]